MRYRVLIGFGVILWMVAGCSLPRVLPPDTETSGEKEIRRINPLTGKEMEKETSGRPWMVMVNNQAQARPQSGLDRADLVAEVLAEGEITRFAAFYYGVREGVVGPIRSVRPYYLDLARGPQAVVTHAGGSPKAMERNPGGEVPQSGWYSWGQPLVLSCKLSTTSPQSVHRSREVAGRSRKEGVCRRHS